MSKEQTFSESVQRRCYDVLLLAQCYEDASNKVAHEYTADLCFLYRKYHRLCRSYHFILLYLSVTHFIDRSVKILPDINQSVAQKRLAAAALHGKK